MKKVVGNLDAISSFVFILLALLTCYLSKRLSLWNPDGPSDGFFPFLGGLALGFFGLCLLVQSLLKPKKDAVFLGDTLKLKLLIYAGSLLAYSILFDWLGSVLATFLFFLSICKGAEKASWKATLIISVLSCGLFFLIFSVLLKVPLPLGLLKPLFLLWGF
jgi:putative tricarboxylic transport membrane protein